MADEEKKEPTEPEENQETGTEPEKTEKSPAEIAAEEAMLAAMQEEEPAAEAGAVEKSPEEIAAEEAMLASLAEEQPTEAAPAGEKEISAKNLNLLMDVNLQVSVELGRRDMNFGDILQLGRGSIVELNKLADEPVDIYVNQSKVAEGEVVVVDEHFGVRVTKLLNSERLKRLG